MADMCEPHVQDAFDNFNQKAHKSDEKEPAPTMTADIASVWEIRGWYMYDWANSPYWQVLDILMKLLLTRLAKLGTISGSYNDGAVSAGSYQASVMLVVTAVQIVVMLTFSAFGDYTDKRLRLLKGVTCLGSLTCVVTIFCYSSQTWWLGGAIRLISGLCFVMANVYYNAFLPMLASASEEVLAAEPRERAMVEEQVADAISAKGMACGYVGGILMQIVCMIILLLTECDRQSSTCSEFDQLFYLGLCISLVGFWWGGFSLFTFRHLKARPGPPMPEGTNIFLIGWQQSWTALKGVCSQHDLRFYCIAYFFWADALSTLVNTAVLVLDSAEGKDSTVVTSSIFGALGGMVGTICWLKLQQCFKIHSKWLIMVQVLILACVSIAALCGALKTLNGIGFYLCFTPMALVLGSLQSLQRSMFSALVPVGQESAMFSFYGITDKGSSFLGYSITVLVFSQTGAYNGVFWYCLFAFLVAAGLLFLVNPARGIEAAGRGAPSQK